MSTIISIFYNIPNIPLYVLMCIVGIAFTLLGIHIIKYILPVELRLRDNVAIGYISANTSVLFAILAGFFVIYMLNSYNRAQDIVRMEVNKLTSIYQNSPRLDKSIATEIQNEVKNYLESVITQEWPAMQEGNKISSPSRSLKKGRKTAMYSEAHVINMINKLNNYKPQDFNKILATAEIYKSLEELYSARDERLALSDSAFNPGIWMVLIITALATIIINFIYGIEHYPLHQTLVLFITIMVISLLFVILVMDKPFRGAHSIRSTQYQEILDSIQTD